MRIIKYLKKTFNVILCIMLLFCSFVIPNDKVEAKTFGDVKRELEKLEASLKENQQKAKYTAEQITAAQNNIVSINKEIENATNEIINLSAEIDKLNEDIKEKTEEIKTIINYAQVSNGESAYLEYIFGAKSFTDFIYRAAISEQLVNYNDKLIDEYNGLIEKNNKKTEELKQKQVSLESKRTSLTEQISILRSQSAELEEGELDLEEQIAAQKEVVKMYQNMGCKDNEDIKTCGTGNLPPDTAFYRPLEAGVVTSEFGWRYLSLYGYSKLHAGTDMSNYYGAPVYASASGMVAYVVNYSTCGGKQVYIHHNIKGQYYTTTYEHLKSINVKKGDYVNSNTVIGYQGGIPGENGDTCTTGSHLHFGVASGLYYKDYSTYSAYQSHSMNPRQYVNLPSGSGRWTNRTKKYN